MTRALVEGPQIDWDLGRLKFVLLAGAALAVLVLGGLCATVVYAIREHTAPAATTTASNPATASTTATVATGAGSEAAKRAIATRAMPHLPDTAAEPGPLIASTTAPITIAKATGTGAAGVPTGFAHTPEGALAQLAAIDESALSTPSMSHAQQVIRGWATADGPTSTSWSGVRGMASILTAANMPNEAQGRLSLEFTVTMGQIKGTVGPDWVLACVDGVLTVTADSTARAAVSDCQQMTWTNGRWMISGPEPAQASDVWPGTQSAYDTGWKDLTRG